MTNLPPRVTDDPGHIGDHNVMHALLRDLGHPFNAETPSDGDLLRFDGGAGKWIPGPPSGVSSFNGRAGDVLPELADYDAFFLTPAEGDASYLAKPPLTDGSILFASGGQVAEDNANLRWDDVEKEFIVSDWSIKNVGGTFTISDMNAPPVTYHPVEGPARLTIDEFGQLGVYTDLPDNSLIRVAGGNVHPSPQTGINGIYIAFESPLTATNYVRGLLIDSLAASQGIPQVIDHWQAIKIARPWRGGETILDAVGVNIDDFGQTDFAAGSSPYVAGITIAPQSADTLDHTGSPQAYGIVIDVNSPTLTQALLVGGDMDPTTPSKGIALGRLLDAVVYREGPAAVRTNAMWSALALFSDGDVVAVGDINGTNMLAGGDVDAGGNITAIGSLIGATVIAPTLLAASLTAPGDLVFNTGAGGDVAVGAGNNVNIRPGGGGNRFVFSVNGMEFVTDNAQDIGAVGALRPRNVYVGSVVDVAGEFRHSGVKVIGSQGALIADADGTLADLTAKFNAWLARARAGTGHGLIAT